MKKINNKGFTLVELISTLTLLLIIATIAIVSINATIERNRDKQRKAQISMIESKALVYYKSHMNSLSNRTCIKINDIPTITDEEKKEYDGTYFEGSLSINSDKTITYQESECNEQSE